MQSLLREFDSGGIVFLVTILPGLQPVNAASGTMPWFVKLEEGIVTKPQFDAVIPAHLAWLKTLKRAGHQPRSGYWADCKGRNGDGAGGMLLFWALDWAEAMLLIGTDPLILQGCVRWSLHEWSLVFGAFESAAPRSGTAAPGPTSAGETPVLPG